jgi:hypothetical protein
MDQNAGYAVVSFVKTVDICKLYSLNNKWGDFVIEFSKV